MKKWLCMMMAAIAFFMSFNVKAEEDIMSDKKVLVAYFSATGVTAKVAERLAQVTVADLFEIKPVRPYTKKDLDWQNPQSRSSVEMRSGNARPEIAEKVTNMSQYDVVFVGFPIWWYREPAIIDTFIESYNFEGKTIVPFATSGVSGIGDSGGNIQKLVPEARVAVGKRFADRVSEEELQSWAKEWL